MASRTTTSCNSLKTLNGFFAVSKVNHRRDFVRENKLNLKELQRHTTQRLLQDKEEESKKQQSYLQIHKKRRENSIIRSVSKQSEYDHTNREGAQGKQCSQMGQRRSMNQQREKQKFGNINGHHHCGPVSSHKPIDQSNGNNNISARRISVTSVISKSESCDKEIQTDDINDEAFLYEALKKCSSTDLKYGFDNESRSISNYDNEEEGYNNDKISQLNYNNYNCNAKKTPNSHGDLKSQKSYLPSETKSQHSLFNDDAKSHSNYQLLNTQRSQHSFEQEGQTSQHNIKAQDNLSQYSMRTRCPQIQSNDHLYKPSDTHYSMQEKNDGDQLQLGMQNLNIDENALIEPEKQGSARSRGTTLSQTIKKKSNGSIYKIGSRDDIRLPRYLEKEKREKEMERKKELSRDPNCPIGFYILPENDRLAALCTAEKAAAELVQELNYMPMTTDTLRLRKRKVEIEKELTKIENDIRLYSKPKVYLPLRQYQR